METARKTSPSLCLLFVFCLASLLAASCGDEDPSSITPPDEIIDEKPDTIPPAAVTTLAVRAPQRHSLALVWNSPGDDGSTGTAATYDIRSSKTEITEENWDQATSIDPSDVPAPKPNGQIETVVVPGLDSGTQYYFALKVSDEAGNESGLSNCATETTLFENVPPADITDLAAIAVDATSFELTWTAPGDDDMSGTASQYDIRYSKRPIIDEENWDHSTPVAVTPSPKPAGESESFIVTGLASETSYFFAAKTVDGAGNWSGVSNIVVALAFGQSLAAAPPATITGQDMYITFKAAPSGVTTVSIHAEVFIPECGESVVQILAFEPSPGGTHTFTYDFYLKDYGRFMPTGEYRISLCYGPAMKEWITVNFEMIPVHRDR